MFTHVVVGANDVAQAKKFYDAAFSALGMPEGRMAGERVYYSSPLGGSFSAGKPANGESACYANGGTIGFLAPNREAVDAFHAGGMANGGTDEGAPGKRPQAPGNVYGAYLRDPCGNKICAFCRLPDGE